MIFPENGCIDGEDINANLVDADGEREKEHGF